MCVEFLTQIIVITVLQSIGTAMLLIVICGAGEVLYRERLPTQLAIPRLRAAGGGSIINLGSIEGDRAAPGFAANSMINSVPPTPAAPSAPMNVAVEIVE